LETVASTLSDMTYFEWTQ